MRERRATRTIGLVVVVTLGIAMIAAGAVVAIAVLRDGGFGAVRGTAQAADYIDVSGGAMPIRRVPSSGSGPHAAAEEHLIMATITDLTTFWSDEMPGLTGRPFVPLAGGLTAMDSTAGTGSAPCVSSPSQIVGNAFYCPSDDGIVYDASTLVPVLLHRYGIGGLVTTFAHEFGHAAQAEMAGTAGGSTGGSTASPSDGSTDSHGSLLGEARADCDAGAFLAWVIKGHAALVHLGEDALVDAVGPMLDFSDPATVSPSDPTAHGLALDRLSWVLRGYRGGATACRAMTTDTMHATLGEVASGSTSGSTPRFTSRRALLAAAEKSVWEFAAPADAATPDGAFDADVREATASGLLDVTAAHGQFAQATVLALTIGRQRSRTSTETACFAGAWVASVFGHAQPGSLGSWPGDADEGLAAVRAQPHVTFADLAAYADGFHGGRSACG